MRRVRVRKSSVATGKKDRSQYFSTKLVLRFGIIMAVVAICAVFAIAAQAQEEKVVKLRFASFWPTTNEYAGLEGAWCKEVEKRTNGRVKVSYFPGGVLAPPPQMFDSLEKGVFDVGSGYFTYHAGRFPFSEILDLPLGYRDGAQSTFHANAFAKKFKPKEYETVHMLLLHASGPSFMQSKNKMTTLDDVKGKRIKSGGTSSLMTEALGGTAVTMPITETYDALAKGLIDAYWGPMEVGRDFKFADIMRYMVMDSGASNATTCWIAMNKKKWDTLPKDVQEIIEKLNEEFIPKFADAHKRAEIGGREYNLKVGVMLVNVSEADKAKTIAKMKPLFDEYVKKTKALGLPGDEAVKFCREYLKTH